MEFELQKVEKTIATHNRRNPRTGELEMCPGSGGTVKANLYKSKAVCSGCGQEVTIYQKST